MPEDFDPLRNYISYTKPHIIKSDIVEIGFGNGDFLMDLCRKNPHKVLFGIEVSDNSIRKLIGKIKNSGFKNVYFTKIDAFWGFQLFLEDKSVEKIYINYPCPWFKKRHFRRRITRREVLLVFFKKLKLGGEIIIRTDWFDFVRYTQEQAQNLFDISVRKIDVISPITKYERKWTNLGKDVYEVVLKKTKDLQNFDDIRTIEILKSEEMSNVIDKIKDLPQVYDFLLKLKGKELRLQDNTVAKIMNPYLGKNRLVAEAIISENSFIQRFFICICEKEDHYIIDVSEFSEVLRTKGILKFLRYLSDLISNYQKKATDNE